MVSVLVLKDAIPPTSVGAASCVCPSKIETVPVGVPVPEVGATLTLRISVWPFARCVADGTAEVVVAVFAGAVTTTVSAVDVDAAKCVSPEYAAVMLCEPFASEEVVKVATPTFIEPVPMELVPSLKVTLPVGLPMSDVDATVAMNCTDWPVVSWVLDAESVVVVAAGATAAGVNTKTVAEYGGKL